MKEKHKHKESIQTGLCGGNFLATSSSEEPFRLITWQVLKTTPKQLTYEHIIEYYNAIHNNKRYTQENLGQIDRTDHVPWICLPQGDLPTVNYGYTQKQCTARGSSWESSIPVSDH